MFKTPLIQKFFRNLAFLLAGTTALFLAGTPDCEAAKHPKPPKIKKEKNKKKQQQQPASPLAKVKLPPSAPNEQQPYALNVVYFLPEGMQPFPDYEKRLSEILLYMQAFYQNQMNRAGYGPDRTFGLNKSDDGKSVNIMLIRAKNGPESYPYEGGAAKATQEINGWFNENPDKRFSNHTLVIMPSTSGNDKKPGGVPFYGYGQFCFALDFPYLDQKYCGAGGDLGYLYTVWAGGMAHELGHGLNLPHNRGNVSDESKFGTALMGSGNSTYGARPTFITDASCAILDCSQTFLSAPVKPLHDHPPLKRAIIRFKYDTKSGEKEKDDSEVESVLIAGEVRKNSRVKHIIVYYDKDEFATVNQDYDAEAFVATWNEDRTKFKVVIPTSEIHPGRTDEYQIRILQVFEDGNISRDRYNFTRGQESDLDTDAAKAEAYAKKKESMPKNKRRTPPKKKK